ncbi:MAG: hypothetical protein K2L13_01355, partial [Opitutales bacterium]|nr:hypothetical protein [Opitutales bacterium]
MNSSQRCKYPTLNSYILPILPNTPEGNSKNRDKGVYFKTDSTSSFSKLPRWVSSHIPLNNRGVSRLKHPNQVLPRYPKKEKNSILLPQEEYGTGCDEFGFGGTNCKQHGIKASSLPDDFFSLKCVDSTYHQKDPFLISLERSINEPDAISEWARNYIKSASNPQALLKISDTLADDNLKIQKWLRDAFLMVEDVSGLFVKEIYTFFHKDQKMIIKCIPKASQLPNGHRGFYVSLAYAYGTWGKGSEKFEFRPLTNLLMLKQMSEVLSDAIGNDMLSCLLLPKIGNILPAGVGTPVKKAVFYQVMPYVDTEVSVRDQILPKDPEKIAKLTANICNAACLANVMMQGDCCDQNVCFIKDEQNDISDIRLFDVDVVDPGDEDDIAGIYDCTNPAAFDFINSEFHRVNDLSICYDVRAALPPIVSKKLLDVISDRLVALSKIAVDYATSLNGETPEVPFMLKMGGMIDQWKDRVMVLSEDGKLYKNRLSDEYIEYDASVALFILSKLHCANDRRSLFISLSFRNLCEIYK